MVGDLRSLPSGQIVSDYRIEGLLGQGGFGITYLAVDTKLNRRSAIKEYYPREFAQRDSTFTIRAAGDKEDRETFAWGLERFLEEARMLARFDHPNIVKVQRFFEKNGTAYLVMDYCEGESLDQIIKRDGPLRKEQVNPILLPLLDGLEHVHGANFLHRDIKPANIFIRGDGSPVLLDFGSARQATGNHTRSVTTLIADGYSPVEQYSANGKQGPWTDVYALGATFYRALTGKVPQDSPSRLLNDELEPVVKKARGNYPDSILASIDAAMVVRPEQRTQSVAKWRQVIGEPSSITSKSEKQEETPKASLESRLEKFSSPIIPSETSKLKKHTLIPSLFVCLFLFLLIYFFGASPKSKELSSGSITPVPGSIARPTPIPGSIAARDCQECPEIVLIPGGDFMMGSLPTEADRDDYEGPVHKVSISRPFFVGKYEVTFDEWDACVRENGCKHKPSDEGWGRGNLPVINVNWFDALAYVDWLTKKTGKKYRLPTEAEWEYIARAGGELAYSYGGDSLELGRHAWFIGNALDRTHAVGQKLPNPFGVHDIYGNVWEWTQDCWAPDYDTVPIDGGANINGDCSMRVSRGGGYAAKSGVLRSASRYGNAAVNRIKSFGFRVVKNN